MAADLVLMATRELARRVEGGRGGEGAARTEMHILTTRVFLYGEFVYKVNSNIQKTHNDTRQEAMHVYVRPNAR